VNTWKEMRTQNPLKTNGIIVIVRAGEGYFLDHVYIIRSEVYRNEILLLLKSMYRV